MKKMKIEISYEAEKALELVEEVEKKTRELKKAIVDLEYICGVPKVSKSRKTIQ